MKLPKIVLWTFIYLFLNFVGNPGLILFILSTGYRKDTTPDDTPSVAKINGKVKARSTKKKLGKREK
jgi:hypothetical protein